MITLTLKLGEQTITGFTFSVTETRVDVVRAMISAKDTNTQVANLWYKNDTEKINEFSKLNANLATALTLSVILQSDDATDVDFYSGTAVNLKDISVKLIIP